MDSNKIIADLVTDGYEREYLDFKAETYRNNEALIKDIMALANSKYEGKKYIIIGVKDNVDGTREVLGLKQEDLTDQANYQQLILANIEPRINFRFYPVQYNQKILGVFELFENDNPPYMLKKDYNKLKAGYCLVRTGSQQNLATRVDFDDFYSRPGNFEIHVLRPYFSATEVEEGCGFIEMSIRNITNRPITILWGELEVLDNDFTLLSRHSLYGIDTVVGADFREHMAPNSEKAGFFHFGFSSTDCLRLGLDEDGLTDQTFKFRITFGDTLRKEYSQTIDQGYVHSRGEFLWKVRQKKAEEEKLYRPKRTLSSLFKK